MLFNVVWLALLTVGVVVGAVTGRLAAVSAAAFSAAEAGVQLAIGLIGVMALWLGLVRLMEASGLVNYLVRLVRPVTGWLFPEVPRRDPAHAAIALNVTANLLGLGNAATPFGIEAMRRLAELEGRSGAASPAMCTLLVLNTACLTLVPTMVVGIRAAAGAATPTDVVGPTLIATLVAQVVALVGERLFRRGWRGAGRD